MICFVYKSIRKADIYLYIEQKGDFSHVPTELLSMFGKPVFVMELSLHNKLNLAKIECETLKMQLKEMGFYLQVSSIDSFF